MTETAKPDEEKRSPFEVNLWGSHPDEENDDCWTGIGFETVEAARRWLDAPVFGPPFFRCDYGHNDTAYLQLVSVHDDGDEEIEVRKNPLYDERAAKRRRAAEDALGSPRGADAGSHGVRRPGLERLRGMLAA